MPLSWNEIKHRAIAFSKEWKDETREEAEAKSFWDAFFHVFGQQRRHLASYKEAVKKLSGECGYIDLLWPGTLLAEHKSAGKEGRGEGERPNKPARNQMLKQSPQPLKDGRICANTLR